MSYVDAETGALLLRDGIVDHAADNPAWKVFPASPPLDYSTTDTRELWCWTITAPSARLPPGGRQRRIAGAVGRRRGARHAVVP